MGERDGYQRLIEMARKINPNLPSDLSGYEVTMSFNRDGMFACAQKVEARIQPDGEG